MKINDNHINRLLKAARSPRHADTPELSFGSQTRIIAGWKSGRDATMTLDLLPLFQFGLGCACALVLIVVAVSLREINRRPIPSVAIQEEVLNLAFTK